MLINKLSDESLKECMTLSTVLRGMPGREFRKGCLTLAEAAVSDKDFPEIAAFHTVFLDENLSREIKTLQKIVTSKLNRRVWKLTIKEVFEEHEESRRIQENLEKLTNKLTKIADEIIKEAINE